MPTYRHKKLQTREALQWNGGNKNEMALFLKTAFIETDDYTNELFLKTKQGGVKAKPGDYVILGPYGEAYPCGKEVFESTYELAE